MNNQSIFTKVGRLKLSDFWRAFFLAIVMDVLTVIYQTVQKGTLTFDWEAIALAGIGAGCAYLLKNLATGQNGKILSNK